MIEQFELFIGTRCVCVVSSPDSLKELCKSGDGLQNLRSECNLHAAIPDLASLVVIAAVGDAADCCNLERLTETVAHHSITAAEQLKPTKSTRL